MAKAQKHYEVTLRVAGDKMATIMALLADEVTLVGMREIASSAPEKKMGFVGGKRLKGIRGGDLLLVSLLAAPKSYRDLEKIFEARGFAKTSTSPAVSTALAARQIAGDRGRYALTDTGKVEATKIVEVKP